MSMLCGVETIDCTQLLGNFPLVVHLCYGRPGGRDPLQQPNNRHHRD